MCGLNHMMTTAIVRLHLTIRSYDRSASVIFTSRTSNLNSVKQWFLCYCVTNSGFFFTVLFFCLSHRAMEALITQKRNKKHSKLFTQAQQRCDFSAGRKSSNRRIQRSFGPSPICVQVLQKSRTDCCRMLNTGALPKTA